MLLQMMSWLMMLQFFFVDVLIDDDIICRCGQYFCQMMLTLLLDVDNIVV